MTEKGQGFTKSLMKLQVKKYGCPMAAARGYQRRQDAIRSGGLQLHVDSAADRGGNVDQCIE